MYSKTFALVSCGRTVAFVPINRVFKIYNGKPRRHAQSLEQKNSSYKTKRINNFQSQAGQGYIISTLSSFCIERQSEHLHVFRTAGTRGEPFLIKNDINTDTTIGLAVLKRY